MHWNLLGAALTLREMTQNLAAQPGGSPMGAFAFDWREDDEAKGTDRDLLDLLNLFWPDAHYPTARISRRGAEATCEKPPRLLFVGDSFFRELIVVASQAPCPPIIDYWFYMRADVGDVETSLARFVTQPGEIANGARLPADLSALPQSFADADAIVLEENEANISLTNQVRKSSGGEPDAGGDGRGDQNPAERPRLFCGELMIGTKCDDIAAAPR